MSYDQAVKWQEYANKIFKYNVRRWPRGPSFVIYILDKSEQTAGKLAKQKVKKVDHRLKRNQHKSLPINALITNTI